MQVCKAIDDYINENGRKVRITYELDNPFELGEEAATWDQPELGQEADEAGYQSGPAAEATFDSFYDELIPRRRGRLGQVWNSLRRGLKLLLLGGLSALVKVDLSALVKVALSTLVKVG